MANEKVKKVKLQQPDGSYGPEIPIGANAQDIDLNNGTEKTVADAVLPTGGTAGQVLTKIDNQSYNAQWEFLPDNNENFYVNITQEKNGNFVSDAYFTDIQEAILKNKKIIAHLVGKLKTVNIDTTIPMWQNEIDIKQVIFIKSLPSNEINNNIYLPYVTILILESTVEVFFPSEGITTEIKTEPNFYYESCEQDYNAIMDTYVVNKHLNLEVGKTYVLERAINSETQTDQVTAIQGSIVINEQTQETISYVALEDGSVIAGIFVDKEGKITKNENYCVIGNFNRDLNSFTPFQLTIKDITSNNLHYKQLPINCLDLKILQTLNGVNDKIDKNGHSPGQILIANDYGILQDGELPNPDLSSYLTKDEADLNYLKSYEMDTTFKDYLKLHRIYEDSDGKRLSNKAITTDGLGYIEFTDKVDSTNFLPKRGLAPNALLLTDYQGNIIQNQWKPYFDDRMRWDYKQEYWGSEYTQAISEFNHDYGLSCPKSLLLYVYFPQDSNAKPQLTLTDSQNNIVFNRDLDCSASDYYLILKFKCFQGLQEIEWAEGFGSNEELYSNYNLIPLGARTYNYGIKQIRIFKNGGTGITLPKLGKIKLMSNYGGLV